MDFSLTEEQRDVKELAGRIFADLAGAERQRAVDESGERFDPKLWAQLAEAGENGTLFGSMAHGHANPPSIQNAMYDVITAHFNGEFDAETAAEEMVTAVELAQ